MNASTHTRIRDYSDRDLLAIVADIAGSNGGIGENVLAEDAAIRIFGLPDDGHGRRWEAELQYAVKCVSSRFSYMARSMGVLEKIERKTWQLTAAGNALRTAKLPAPVQRSLRELSERNLLAVAHEAGERMFNASGPVAVAMRREFVWQHERRRREQP